MLRRRYSFAPVSASVLTTLVAFNLADGANLRGSLITDANGDLFGTTANGGGTVFEIVKNGSSYASTPTTLVNFNNGFSGGPEGSLIADANGDLFGTHFGTFGGPDYGTVFEIMKTSTGYASTPTTLVSFDATDGANPSSGLIADAQGDLFGTTANGGANGDGTVFEIVNTGGSYATAPITLVSFDKTTYGASPRGSLIADANGDLFGTAVTGGANGYSTVFEITLTGTTYASTPTILVSFDGTDGADPAGSLIADAQGNLFGTTVAGGANGDGTVFEIMRTGTNTYASTPPTLASFDNTDGASPFGSLISDANGDLFGTTESGGLDGEGTVFEIANTGSGYASAPTTLFSFTGSNGGFPLGSLIADANANMFGTTMTAGANGGARCSKSAAAAPSR